MGHVRQATPAQRRRVATLRRNGALDRLRTITATIAVVTALSVGIVAVYVSKALPGHQGGAATNTTASNGAGSATAPTGSTGQSSLNPASTPTQSASTPPPVTSGAT